MFVYMENELYKNLDKLESEELLPTQPTSGGEQAHTSKFNQPICLMHNPHSKFVGAAIFLTQSDVSRTQWN